MIRKDFSDIMIGKLWQLGCFQEDPDKIIKWFVTKYRFHYRKQKADHVSHFYYMDFKSYIIDDPRAHLIDKTASVKFQIMIKRGRSSIKSVVFSSTKDDWRIVLIERFLDYFRCVDGVVKGPKESYAEAWTKKEWK